jgi:hypothetical protein
MLKSLAIISVVMVMRTLGGESKDCAGIALVDLHYATVLGLSQAGGHLVDRSLTEVGNKYLAGQALKLSARYDWDPESACFPACSRPVFNVLAVYNLVVGIGSELVSRL